MFFLQENDIHLDTNESNENNSAADDLPSFIDHNRFVNRKLLKSFIIITVTSITNLHAVTLHC